MNLAFNGKYLQHPVYLSKDQDPFLWQKNVLAEVETPPLMILVAVKTVIQIVLTTLAVRRTTVLTTAVPTTMAVAPLEAEEVVDGEGAQVAEVAAPTTVGGGAAVAAETTPAATETITTTDRVDKIANRLNSTTRN